MNESERQSKSIEIPKRKLLCYLNFGHYLFTSENYEVYTPKIFEIYTYDDWEMLYTIHCTVYWVVLQRTAVNMELECKQQFS